jgi:hypothetical protein
MEAEQPTGQDLPPALQKKIGELLLRCTSKMVGVEVILSFEPVF